MLIGNQVHLSVEWKRINITNHYMTIFGMFDIANHDWLSCTHVAKVQINTITNVTY